ncbi:CDP-alcohol phosphatidyltransferase family protein [bacterium SCSIO 12741]|nr:CDP-alcohol phosphatidyltransferase family protein [bacterium SCSIO 12741]
MTIYELKPQFQRLLSPAVNAMYRWGFTPNLVTILGFGVSIMIGVGAMQAIQNPMWALIWPAGLLLRMALNAIDGLMARRFNRQTKLGGVLNESMDILSDIVVTLPLLVLFPSLSVLIWIFIVQAVLMEGAGMLGYLSQVGRSYKGPLGKSDRAFMLGVLGILVALGVPVGTYAFEVLVGLNLLIHIGFLNRLNHVW